MGPDWADDYNFPAPGPATGPTAPPPAPSAEPALPTEHPPVMMAAAAMAPPSSSGSRARAGLIILMTALGTGVGAALGGVNGAGAGFLFTGAARNLYRAQSGLGSDDGSESAKSLTLGLLGVALGGYLVYRCFAKKKPRNSDAD